MASLSCRGKPSCSKNFGENKSRTNRPNSDEIIRKGGLSAITNKFYDTCALLASVEHKELFETPFYISSITLRELEHIKISNAKDEEVKFKARKLSKLLDENYTSYFSITFDQKISNFIKETLGLDPLIPDNQIVGTACYMAQSVNDLVFITNDVCLKNIARDYGLNVKSVARIEDTYTGYIEKSLSEMEMAYFYEHLQENKYSLLANQYLILKNNHGEIVDKLKWSGEEYQSVKFPNIKSNDFGVVKPYNGDIYQQLALNSLTSNQVTMIKGVAGTGKSYLAIGCMLWLLEKHKIDKIIMFANPIPTVNSAKIGFLPGSQLDKLIDSSVGNMLSGKLGDKYAIEQMVSQNKLSILPMCDIRGFDTSGLNCAIYITEAQNLDVSLMKLALQRIGDDSICIIDGDYSAQVDLSQYAGNNNGMRRMSEIFRGQDFYGEVELKNIYRSRISQVAELM